jgi:hypothetical protein
MHGTVAGRRAGRHGRAEDGPRQAEPLAQRLLVLVRDVEQDHEPLRRPADQVRDVELDAAVAGPLERRAPADAGPPVPRVDGRDLDPERRERAHPGADLLRRHAGQRRADLGLALQAAVEGRRPRHGAVAVEAGEPRAVGERLA